jgi:hypothetical protein
MFNLDRKKQSLFVRGVVKLTLGRNAVVCKNVSAIVKAADPGAAFLATLKRGKCRFVVARCAEVGDVARLFPSVVSFGTNLAVEIELV